MIHVPRAVRPAQPRPGQTTFSKVLALFRELRQPFHIHFDATSQQLTLIDRLFDASPPWTAKHLDHTIRIKDHPEKLTARGGSDHAIAIVIWALMRRLHKSSQPVSPEITREPRYRQLIADAAKSLKLGSSSTWNRHAAHEFMLKEAALVVRKEISDTGSSECAGRCGTAAAARAVWAQNDSYASRLIQRNAVAKRHLRICEGKVARSLLSIQQLSRSSTTRRE